MLGKLPGAWALSGWTTAKGRLLAIDASAPWLGYFGYGAGIVRLGIGANTELNGAIGGSYFRWRDLIVDGTVTIDDEVWVTDGKLVR